MHNINHFRGKNSWHASFLNPTSLEEVKAGTFLVDQDYENTHQTILKRLRDW